MSTEFLLLIATLAFVFYVWQRRTFNYWKKLGVKYIKPSPLFGNVRTFLTGRVSFMEQISFLHNTKGFEKEPLIGVYLLHRPALVIRDLELIKTVMIKKISHFTNRSLQTDPHHDPLGYNNLFFVRNKEWKDLRNKISPVFTSGKIKQMYPLMLEIGKNLEKHLSRVPADSVVSIKNICTRLTTDLIATIAFGLDANSLEDMNSHFFKYNKAMFDMSLSRGIDFIIIFMLPMLATLARVKVFSKQASNFMRHSINYVLTEREKSGVRRNDLIDILLAMKREANAQPPEVQNKARELDYLVAQAALFQTAGFETSSSTMTFALFECAHNTEIQDRLRQEVLDYFGDNDHIDYERIMEMPFMSQVVNETLRKYPIVGYVERESSPPSNEDLFNLKPYCDVDLPAGIPVYVATLAIHRDESYWPEPEKFIPERFAPENRDKLILDAYMPFGIGPRNCIGMRLGLLQVKLGLAHLLRNHRVVACDKTIKSIKFGSFTPVLASDKEIFLKLQKV